MTGVSGIEDEYLTSEHIANAKTVMVEMEFVELRNSQYSGRDK